MLMMMLVMTLMAMAVNPSVSKVGNRWKLAIGGVIGSAVLTIVVVNSPTTTTVTVTQNGSSQQVVTSTANASSVLTPGSGFSGATSQPAQVGTGAYATEPAIARWNVVPWQTVAGTLKIGVVAYHLNGIDRVEFNADDGSVVTVSSASLNSDSGTTEYWTTLDAANFSDGVHEIRATVYPTVGVPVVLQGNIGDAYTISNNDGICSLVLNTNHGATLPTHAVYVSSAGHDDTGDGSSGNPLATIVAAAVKIQDTYGSCDGGIIYCNEATHEIGSPQWWQTTPVTTNRWLTIKPWPGASKANVKIQGAAGEQSGLGCKLLALDGVTQLSAFRFADIRLNATKVVAFWANNVAAAGTVRLSDISPWGIKANVGFNMGFATGCTVHTMDDGFNAWMITRDCSTTHTVAGGYRNVGLVVNCTSDDISAAEYVGDPALAPHPDVYQFSISMRNTIALNLVGTDVPFIRTVTYGGGTSQDAALVNCSFDASSAYAWEFGGTNINVYVKGCTFTKGFSTYEPLTFTDFVCEGCTFGGGSPPAGVTVR